MNHCNHFYCLSLSLLFLSLLSQTGPFRMETASVRSCFFVSLFLLCDGKNKQKKIFNTKKINKREWKFCVVAVISMTRYDGSALGRLALILTGLISWNWIEPNLGCGWWPNHVADTRAIIDNHLSIDCFQKNNWAPSLVSIKWLNGGASTLISTPNYSSTNQLLVTVIVSILHLRRSDAGNGIRSCQFRFSPAWIIQTNLASMSRCCIEFDCKWTAIWCRLLPPGSSWIQRMQPELIDLITAICDRPLQFVMALGRHLLYWYDPINQSQV